MRFDDEVGHEKPKGFLEGFLGVDRRANATIEVRISFREVFLVCNIFLNAAHSRFCQPASKPEYEYLKNSADN